MPESTNQPAPSGDLLTTEEVAALLRVTPAWVYAETRQCRAPHIRLGRYVRYRRDALAAWMDNSKIGQVASPGVDQVVLAATEASRPRGMDV